jgi:hypothetical protein
MNQAALGVLLLLLIGVSTFSFGQSGASEPLKLEAMIPMPDVQGRIDHLSIDVKGQRLFVAALGNNSLEIVDLKQNKLIHSISGLAEPQGVAYLPSSNRVFVANGKDGLATRRNPEIQLPSQARVPTFEPIRTESPSDRRAM